LHGALAPRGTARHTISENIRGREVVPGTTLAHLDDVHPELSMVPGHRLELLGLPDPAGVLPELVAEHVGDMGEGLLPTDRARPDGLLAAELRGPQKRRIGIADVVHPDGATVEQRLQRRTALQAVVDHGSLGPHVNEGTA